MQSFLCGIGTLHFISKISPKISVVFCWLRYERSRKRFSHTHLGVWVLVCGGYRSHGPWDCSLFLLLFAIAWPPTHPPTLLVVRVFSCKFFPFHVCCEATYLQLQQFLNYECYECYECTFSKLFFHWFCELVADFSRFFHCLACCIGLTAFCMCFNKGQAAWFGLAWLPVVCEK